jgi:hypothetical protein
MKEESVKLGNYLKEKFGQSVSFSYVDVQSEEMKNYPEISAILKQVRLPLTVINGEPKLHGGLSLSRIEKAMSEFLAKVDSSKG